MGWEGAKGFCTSATPGYGFYIQNAFSSMFRGCEMDAMVPGSRETAEHGVAVDLLRSVQALEEREVERALRRLPVDPEVQREARRLASQVARRIVSTPIRSLSRSGDGETTRFARRLFGL